MLHHHLVVCRMVRPLLLVMGELLMVFTRYAAVSRTSWIQRPPRYDKCSAIPPSSWYDATWCCFSRRWAQTRSLTLLRSWSYMIGVPPFPPNASGQPPFPPNMNGQPPFPPPNFMAGPPGAPTQGPPMSSGGAPAPNYGPPPTSGGNQPTPGIHPDRLRMMGQWALLKAWYVLFMSLYLVLLICSWFST